MPVSLNFSFLSFQLGITITISHEKEPLGTGKRMLLAETTQDFETSQMKLHKKQFKRDVYFVYVCMVEVTSSDC